MADKKDSADLERQIAIITHRANNLYQRVADQDALIAALQYEITALQSALAEKK